MRQLSISIRNVGTTLSIKELQKNKIPKKTHRYGPSCKVYKEVREQEKKRIMNLGAVPTSSCFFWKSISSSMTSERTSFVISTLSAAGLSTFVYII